MFKRVLTGISAWLLLTAPFSSAEAALLAKVEADVDGSGQKKVVELTGDKRIPGSNYYSNADRLEGRPGWRILLPAGKSAGERQSGTESYKSKAERD